MKNLPVSKGAWTRLLLLLLAILNQTLTMMGYSTLPILPEDLEVFIGLSFLFATGMGAWWKDNDITTFARYKKKVAEDEIDRRLEISEYPFEEHQE